MPPIFRILWGKKVPRKTLLENLRVDPQQKFSHVGTAKIPNSSLQTGRAKEFVGTQCSAV